MSSMRNWTIGALAIALGTATGARAQSAAERCEAAKLKLAGKYTLCRLKAEAKAVKSGGAADPSRCDSSLAQKWSAAESSAGGACPTEGDQAAVRDHLAADADVVALELAGARFVDNGDGTITDTQTHLMWEKKDDGGGLHDRDATYGWKDATSVFLGAVNGVSGDGTVQPGLGGHNDWRLPNTAELQTILAAPYPCATNPCIDPLFGPTVGGFHWSSTQDTTHPTFSWGVMFDTGHVDNDEWGKDYSVRAVRGGS
jgi:hypothetical protein